MVRLELMFMRPRRTLSSPPPQCEHDSKLTRKGLDGKLCGAKRIGSSEEDVHLHGRSVAGPLVEYIHLSLATEAILAHRRRALASGRHHQ